MIDMWHRLEQLIGNGNLEILKNKNILIVGLGGVGGYVVEGLVRCGISHLTIVDADRVDISNINRQIIALHSTIGKEKADLLKERCLDINKDINIRSKVIFVDDNNLLQLFDQNYDYVVDACDTVKTKKLLIAECLNRKIPIISCMGTARKLDPTKLSIMDIRKTSYDPLARIIRQYMKKEFPNQKLMVLSSEEIPKCSFSDTLGSIIFVPAIAGFLIANYIISELMNKKDFTK